MRNARSRLYASAVHTYGAEWSPDPGFDVPADWTLTGTSTVAGSIATIGAGISDHVAGTMASIPPAGVYRIRVNCTSLPTGSGLRVNIGGVFTNFSGVVLGVQDFFTASITPASTLLWYGGNPVSENGAYDSISIMQQLT